MLIKAEVALEFPQSVARGRTEFVAFELGGFDLVPSRSQRTMESLYLNAQGTELESALHWTLPDKFLITTKLFLSMEGVRRSPTFD